MEEAGGGARRKPITLDALALRLARYQAATERRFRAIEEGQKSLSELVQKGPLNGELTILKKLEPLAEAADDLAQMARNHREEAQVQKARLIVDAAAARSRARQKEELEGQWWYRVGQVLRAVGSDAGGKVYYAILGAIGFFLVGQVAGPAIAGFFSHVLRISLNHP